MNGPAHWQELNHTQQAMVERYIQTLLMQQEPLVGIFSRKDHEVVEQKIDGGVSYQLERVKCGKNCKGCPHGPYWYAYYRKNGKVVSKYIGKDFKRIEQN